MFEGFHDVLILPGLWAMLVAVLLSGIVYGFAGFGSALIAMPVLTRSVEPEVAVLSFGLAGLGAAVTMLPRVWPQADQRATLWMLLHRALACTVVAGAVVISLPLFD